MDFEKNLEDLGFHC